MHNRAWWTRKLTSIQFRDAQTVDHLTAVGWLPLRIWEHEDMDGVADQLAALWRSRRGPAG